MTCEHKIDQNAKRQLAVREMGQQPVGRIGQQAVAPLPTTSWWHTLRDKLPSIEQIERQLGMDGRAGDLADAGRAGV